MKKIAIRYYTKTGHTKKLASAISEEINIKAEEVSVPLSEKVDILFLGCSYYAFDIDSSVKEFLSKNQEHISAIICFGTSAMMKSMLKPIKKVTKDYGIKILEDEFHCRGQFKIMHKGRPNDSDISAIKLFLKNVLEKYEILE